jgi:hypothetical protein
METKPHLGNNEFAGPVKNVGLAPGTEGTFKFKLSLNGVPIGWMGKGGSQSMWARLVKEEKDAVPLEWYSHDGIDYLRIPGTGYKWMLTWSDGLSGKPIAFNDWAHANGWEEEGGHLIAADSGQKVSVYDTDVGWLYANSNYKVIEFFKVAIALEAAA